MPKKHFLGLKKQRLISGLAVVFYSLVLALLPGFVAIPKNPTGYYSQTALAQNEDADSETIPESQSCTERVALSSGWIVCGILEAVSDGITSIFDIADSMLNVDGQNLYENQELRTVWSYFRIVATFALVIIGLVMVISQGIGGRL